MTVLCFVLYFVNLSVLSHEFVLPLWETFLILPCCTMYTSNTRRVYTVHCLYNFSEPPAAAVDLTALSNVSCSIDLLRAHKHKHKHRYFVLLAVLLAVLAVLLVVLAAVCSPDPASPVLFY